MNTKYICLAGLIATTPAIAADSAILRDVMGETVYRESGIEQLSDEQLRVLEQWILDNADEPSRAQAPASVPQSARGQDSSDRTSSKSPTVPSAPATSGAPAQSEDQDVIHSHIDGHFEGWRNNGTLFRLKNGQIWEQRQPATFIADLDSPEVIIRPNRFGYTMEVPAIDRKVHVRRVR